MGKRARERRKEEKRAAKVLDFTLAKTARLFGFKENELGELRAVMTKAEARRRFIRWREACAAALASVRAFDPVEFCKAHANEIERDLVNALSSRIAEDIDREVLGELAAAI